MNTAAKLLNAMRRNPLASINQFVAMAAAEKLAALAKGKKALFHPISGVF